MPLLLGLKRLPAAAQSLLGWQVLLCGSNEAVGTVVQVGRAGAGMCNKQQQQHCNLAGKQIRDKNSSKPPGMCNCICVTAYQQQQQQA